MNEKPLERINELLDAYETLLTQKQQEMMSLYFKEDFSLSEIAENMEISRAAVNDALKRSEKVLIQYEEKLKLVEKFKKRNELFQLIKKMNHQKVNEIIDDLEKIDETGGTYE